MNQGKFLRNLSWSAALLSGVSALAQGPSPSDLQLANKLSEANVVEIELGKMVVQKSKNTAVKQFAQRMIDDHSALQGQLKQWADTHHVTLSERSNADTHSMKSKLSRLSGDEFDKRYIQDMLQDHQKDTAELQSYLTTTPQSPLKPLISKTLPILENHLRVVENVAGQLGIPPQGGLNQPEHPMT